MIRLNSVSQSLGASLITACMLFMHTNLAFSLTKAEHSKVVATAKKQKDKLALTFIVIPHRDIVINMDGPWRLQLTETEGLSLENSIFGKNEMSENLPGFAITAPVVKAGKPIPKGGYHVSYKLTAFICTKDKVKCFRDVHEGRVNW